MCQREAVIKADLEPEGAGAGEMSGGSKSSHCMRYFPKYELFPL